MCLFPLYQLLLLIVNRCMTPRSRQHDLLLRQDTVLWWKKSTKLPVDYARFTLTFTVIFGCRRGSSGCKGPIAWFDGRDQPPGQKLWNFWLFGLLRISPPTKKRNPDFSVTLNQRSTLSTSNVTYFMSQTSE